MFQENDHRHHLTFETPTPTAEVSFIFSHHDRPWLTTLPTFAEVRSTLSSYEHWSLERRLFMRSSAVNSIPATIFCLESVKDWWSNCRAFKDEAARFIMPSKKYDSSITQCTSTRCTGCRYQKEIICSRFHILIYKSLHGLAPPYFYDDLKNDWHLLLLTISQLRFTAPTSTWLKGTENLADLDFEHLQQVVLKLGTPYTLNYVPLNFPSIAFGRNWHIIPTPLCTMKLVCWTD